jgi:hypothetical protein
MNIAIWPSSAALSRKKAAGPKDKARLIQMAQARGVTGWSDRQPNGRLRSRL